MKSDAFKNTIVELAIDDNLHIECWSDPLVEAFGHDPRSAYVERFWLPVLGPSTTWLLRHFASQLDRHPVGCTLDVHETARALGLGEHSSRRGPFLRTISRAIDFEMAVVRGSRRLAVRRALPPLARRHLIRLPEALRAEHERLEADDSLESLQRRGRRLARSLLDLGESEQEVERQLMRWRFHPALASRCVQWARDNDRAEGEEKMSAGHDRVKATLASTGARKH